MLTRCPHCQTAFRVTSAQLKVRHGRVRCGVCRQVFDALTTLADEAPPPVVREIPVQVQETVAVAQRSPDAAPSAPWKAVPETLPAEPKPPAGRESPAHPTEKAATDALEESRPPQDGATVAEAMPVVPASQAAERKHAEELLQAAQPEAIATTFEVAAQRRWPWHLGNAALLLLALGQALFFFRVELAVLVPQLRPMLSAACEVLGCTLPLPRKPELVAIESSDLAPAEGNRLLLTALIRNRAPFAQEYPHLELTLTDTRDEPLLRKVLAPDDWLPAERPAAAGFAAQGEVAVDLTLEAAGVPAIGYRLYLFYP